MRPELLIYTILFILIGWLFISFFLLWRWYDAVDHLAIVRANTREETIRAIRRGQNKCRAALYAGIVAAGLFTVVLMLSKEFYSMLFYPGVIFAINVTALALLYWRANQDIQSIDECIEENEAYAREHEAEEERQREQWRQEAPERNARAKERIKETMGANYETLYEDDILLEHNILVNREEELLYAQGVVIPFSQLREVYQGRRSLKLLTSNSMHPFIKLSFGQSGINPKTGAMYKNELEAPLKALMN